MPSTLGKFRKHQRVLMVITTGLSMISFVLLGSVRSRPGQMPAVLIVLALAAMIGGAAWVIGLINKKSTEYGTIGAIAGAALGVAMSWGGGSQVAVYADSGNITAEQLQALRSRHSTAVEFVRRLQRTLYGFDIGADNIFRRRGGNPDEEAVIAELLRREAARLGMKVPPSAVFDFIKGLSPSPERTLTQPQFQEIQESMRVSENQLLSAVAAELEAQKALQILFDPPAVPPASLWEYYKKLNVREEAAVAIIPVNDFIKSDGQPPAGELESFFEMYRHNIPGRAPNGRLEEGRPGFFQPMRVKLAYLEAVGDDFEKLVGPISDAEVEQRYETSYKSRPLVRPGSSPFDDGGSVDLEGDEPPPPPTAVKKGALPPAPAPDGLDQGKIESPSGLPKATEDNRAPAGPAPPSTSTPVLPPANPDLPAPQPPAETPPDRSSSAIPAASSLQFVAVDAPPDDSPSPVPAPDAADPGTGKSPDGDATAADSSPAPVQRPPEADQPPENAPGDAPQSPLSPPTAVDNPFATDDAGTELPKLPTLQPAIRPLDDALRARIRDELMRERADELMEQKMDDAIGKMAELGMQVMAPSQMPEHLPAEDAAKDLRAYAAANNLHYVETPWMSDQEMRMSEDYPIGTATLANDTSRARVIDEVFRNFGRGMRYQPRQAFTPYSISLSRFAFWTTGERDAEVPEDLSEDLVRDQVVQAWREVQARKPARERAEQVAKIVRESTRPIGETLSEVTITGLPATGYIAVRPTGLFSWYTLPSAPQTGFRDAPPPRLTELPGLAGLGNEFMSVVFDKLQPGEVGIAESVDKSEIYVVKVESRSPSTTEEWDSLRNRFLAHGIGQEYRVLESDELSAHSRDPLQDLWERQNVRLMEVKPREPDDY